MAGNKNNNKKSAFTLPDQYFFHSESEASSARAARMQQLEVLTAELGSLRPGARVFQGPAGQPGTVFLQAPSVAGVRAEAKRELDGLRKVAQGQEKRQLNF